MSDLWFTLGIPAAAGIATAVYTTGGRAALARRALKQELEIVEQLPAGSARDALEHVISEKAVIYAARWIGPGPLNVKQHLLIAGVVGVGVVLTWLGNQWLQTQATNRWASSSALLLWTTGFGLTIAALVSWITMVFAAEAAKSRADTARAHHDRVRDRLANVGPHLHGTPQVAATSPASLSDRPTHSTERRS